MSAEPPPENEDFFADTEPTVIPTWLFLAMLGGASWAVVAYIAYVCRRPDFSGR